MVWILIVIIIFFLIFYISGIHRIYQMEEDVKARELEKNISNKENEKLNVVKEGDDKLIFEGFEGNILSKTMAPSIYFQTIGELCLEHQNRLDKKIVKYPAHKFHEEYNFVDLWHFTRLEWFEFFFHCDGFIELTNPTNISFQSQIMKRLIRGDFYSKDELPSNDKFEIIVKSISDEYLSMEETCIRYTTKINGNFMHPRKLLPLKETFMKYSIYHQLLTKMEMIKRILILRLQLVYHLCSRIAKQLE